MSGHSDETGAKRSRFRFLKSAQTWVALFSLLGVLLIALVDIDRTSPGPLSAVHGALAELENGANCSACHGGIFSGMTDSCLECHEPIAEQISLLEGLHGTFSPEQADRCVACHSEHHGEEFALVSTRSFSEAGIEDAQHFDHLLVGFEMEGKHRELDCNECHYNADVAVLPEGERRFIGLDPKCVRCHDDPHRGRMVRACTDCHDQNGFEGLHLDNHREHLDLIGGHRDVDCRACHAEGEKYGLEALARGLGQLEERACADCHAAPHQKSFVTAVAELKDQTEEASCVTCHRPEHRSFRGDGDPEEVHNAQAFDGALVKALSDLVTPRLHAASGFSLGTPHADLDCGECHGEDDLAFDDRFLEREQEGCSECHSDPHGGQFEEGLFAGQECTACHRRDKFAPHRFGLEAHGKTEFPLEATHGETDCAACHFDSLGTEPRSFRGTKQRCENCHGDAHQGYFESQMETLAISRPEGNCAECHLPTEFSDVPLAAEHEAGGESAGATGPRVKGEPLPFEHDLWTGFEVRGAHAQADCESCHPRAADADPNGRRFGQVKEHFGEHAGCITCHGDPHEGIFDKRRLPKVLNGERDCLRCHVETSFRALPNGFDHELWTKFRLDGAHKEAYCDDCHVRAEGQELEKFTWANAVGSNCNDCHRDPHAAQFEVRDVTNCSKCHRSAEAWNILRFDHEYHSRFPLGDAHAEVDCSSCHQGWELESGEEIVRYRPLETDCASCHGAQQGRTLRSRGRRK